MFLSKQLDASRTWYPDTASLTINQIHINAKGIALARDIHQPYLVAIQSRSAHSLNMLDAWPGQIQCYPCCIVFKSGSPSSELVNTIESRGTALRLKQGPSIKMLPAKRGWTHCASLTIGPEALYV